MAIPTAGFFRCYTCFTVVYLTWGDLHEKNANFSWDYERGDLYVNSCGVCHHWRHYEPLGTFDKAKEKQP